MEGCSQMAKSNSSHSALDWIAQVELSLPAANSKSRVPLPAILPSPPQTVLNVPSHCTLDCFIALSFDSTDYKLFSFPIQQLPSRRLPNKNIYDTNHYIYLYRFGNHLQK